MSKIESSFQQIDALVEAIETELDLSYMDSLLVALEYLFTTELPTNITEVLADKMEKVLKKLGFETLEKEEIRKVIELTILKSMKNATQAQHLITPDTVALYMSYVAGKLVDNSTPLRIFDPVCGTANLLTAVINQLAVGAEAYGSEIDSSLIKLGLLSANLQKTEIEFFNQDSIQPLLVDPVDLIIADLPVGYYPDDVRSSQFEIGVKDEHTYAHHLLIEQSVHYTKPGGYLLFVVPNFLFDSDQATKLHAYLQKNVHVIGLLQLPTSVFRSDKQAKSIFILQKKSEHTKPPKEALMAQLPSFKDSRATENIVNKMNQWFKKEGY